MNTHFVKNASNVLPAGEYFIGDICYFLQDHLTGVWSTDYEKCDGLYTNDSGYGFGVVKPYSGNGIYMGSNRFSYDVDDENLGIVAKSLGDLDKYTGCGTFHKFVAPVTMTWLDGIVTFKSDSWSMNINTNHNEDIDSSDDMDGYDSWS